jgi:hypothetical protein
VWVSNPLMPASETNFPAQACFAKADYGEGTHSAIVAAVALPSPNLRKAY